MNILNELSNNLTAMIANEVLLHALAGSVGFAVILAVAAECLRFARNSGDPTLSRSLLLIIPALTLSFTIVQTNISLSVGLIGSLAFIRFRTSIESGEELCLLLVGVTTALTCAVHNYVGAIFIVGFTFVYALIVMLCKKFRPKAPHITTSFLVEGNLERSCIEDLLAKIKGKPELISHHAASDRTEFCTTVKKTKQQKRLESALSEKFKAVKLNPHNFSFTSSAKKSTLILSLLIVTIVAAVLILSSSTARASDFKVDGRVSGGLQVKNGRGAPDYNVAAKIKTKRNKNKWRAVIGAKAVSSTTTVELKEALVDRKTKNSRFQFGFGKKRFGRSYSAKKSQRLTISRSNSYRRMEEWGYVGRGPNIRYQKEVGEFEWSVLAGTSQSLDSYLISHWQHQISSKDHQVGQWLLLQADRIERSYQPVWATTTALWGEFDLMSYEFELGAGVDPYESEYRKIFGTGTQAHFGFFDLQTAVNLGGIGLSKTNLVLAGGMFFPDLDKATKNTREGVIGMAYQHSNQLSVSYNSAFIGNSNKGAEIGRISHDRRHYLEVVYEL